MMEDSWLSADITVEEFILGVYEWICTADSISHMGERIERINQKNKEDEEISRAAAYALVYHPHCNDVRHQVASADVLQGWGQKVLEDFRQGRDYLKPGQLAFFGKSFGKKRQDTKEQIG